MPDVPNPYGLIASRMEHLFRTVHSSDRGPYGFACISRPRLFVSTTAPAWRATSMFASPGRTRLRRRSGTRTSVATGLSSARLGILHPKVRSLHASISVPRCVTSAVHDTNNRGRN